jgi:ribosomal protein S12 methylthiotransferase accessory factor
MNNLPAREIDIVHSSAAIPFKKIYHERFEVPGYEYLVYDITNDLGIPTTYVILIAASPRGTIYAIGAASRLDGVESVFKAVMEAVQGKPYVLHEMQQEPTWRPREDFSDVNDFSRTCKVYSVETRLVPHLLSVRERAHSVVKLEDLPRGKPPSAVAAIQEIVAKFRERDYEAIAVDVTTRDIEGLGMKVVRVITPELQHLHAQHTLPFLGGRRLLEVPQTLGVRDRPTREDELCPYPHPFP